jgi:hypothetical protein
MLIAAGRGDIYSDASDGADYGKVWHKMADERPEAPYDLFAIRATLAKDTSIPPKGRVRGYQILRNGVNVADPIIYGTDLLWSLNNFTDLDPFANSNEACYTVKVYYTYQEYSEAKSDCVSKLNGIDLVKDAGGLKVYPNILKKNETLTVELSNATDRNQSMIRIYDIAGKKVQEIQAAGKSIPVQLKVEAGVYILKVNDKYAVKLIVR